MEPPATPGDEAARLQMLHRYDILDSSPEEFFDRITRIASRVAGVPISLISLVAEDRQWFKAKVGLDAEQTGRDISFCGHAILGDEPLVVPDATLDPRFADNPLVLGEPGIRFYMGVPLTAPGGQNIGTLCAIDRRPRTLDEDQKLTLLDLAQMAVRELELRRIAMTDALTGALNRRMLDRMLERVLAEAKRTGRPFSLALLDLDRFKRVNDWYGHAAGDLALLHCTRVMGEALAPEDTLFRFDGEAFCILHAAAPAAEAAGRLEHLRADIEALEVAFGESRISVTVSGGLAEWNVAGSESGAALLRRADRALHAAQEAGRNRIETAAPAPA